MHSRLGAVDASVAVATDRLEVDEVAAAGADKPPRTASQITPLSTSSAGGSEGGSSIPAPGLGGPYPCPLEKGQWRGCVDSGGGAA
jgi:hypothetical protein